MEKLIINDEVYSHTQDDYCAIKEAIEKIASVSQEEFEQIKEEKWYSRVFDMVTFSQKGKRRIAEQVGTLAQAQQILIEILCILSADNENISEIVKESQKNIKKISEQNIHLRSKIRHLEDAAWGVKTDMDIKNLTVSEKEVLSACLYRICDQLEQPSDEQKIYAEKVMNYLGVDVQMQKLDAALKEVDTNVKKRILNCCMEYMFLKDCTDHSYDEYIDFIEEFDVGNKSIAVIKEQISLLYKLRGKEGFYSKFLCEDGCNELDDIEWTAEESNEVNELYLKKDYSGIKEMVSGIIGGMMKQNSKNENKEKSEKDKKIYSFIQKYNSHIAFDAAIEYVKLSNAEILFTTCGMNVALKGQKGLTNIKYADIDSKWVLSTDKENAKSECTKLIIDDGKGHRLEIEDKSEYVGGIEKILSDSKKCTYAVTDIIIDEKEWPMQAKCLMGEILVDVYKLYYKKSTIESIRLFNDLSVSVEQILELFAYYGSSEPSEGSVTDKIEAFVKYIPYPSKKSAGFTLGCKMVEMVQFSERKPDERPTNIRKIIESICDICKLKDYRDFGSNCKTDQKKKSEDKKEIWEKLWDIGALPYRILKKKATSKEINEVGLELAGMSVGVGVPVAFSVIESILFRAGLGIAAMPGLILWPALGVMATGGVVGRAVGGIANGINKVKKEDIDSASEKELWKIERSYLNLYNNIQNMEDDKIRKIITDEIIKASGNADSGIKDCIRAYSTGKHSKDEFYIQAIKEKLSAKGAENKSGFILKTLLDMEEDKSAETLSKMLKRTYDVPVNSRKYNLKHHQILAVYESKKSKDLALVFTYEGLAITKKMIGDGDRADRFVFYREITKFRADSKRLLLYLTIGHTNKKEDEVAISFFNPGILTELLVRLRQIEVTVFS